MRVLVNDQFVAYANTFFDTKRGDPNYVPEFDFNSDGVIDATDTYWLGLQLGKWIEIGGTPIPVMGLAIAGGLALAGVITYGLLKLKK